MGSFDSALHRYDRWLATHPTVTGDIRRVLDEELSDAGISYDQVSVRIKDRRSFLTKLRNPAFPDYRDFDSAHDVIGIRITSLTASEIPLLVSVMRNLFAVEEVIDKAAKTVREGRFGYASRHVIARVDSSRLPELESSAVGSMPRRMLNCPLLPCPASSPWFWGPVFRPLGRITTVSRWICSRLMELPPLASSPTYARQKM